MKKLGLKNCCASGWLQLLKSEDGGGRKIFLLFFFHDLSSNITQQLIKKQTDSLNSTHEN